MKFFNLHKKTVHTDEELIVLLKKTHNLEYFQQLYERYMPLVYGLCLKYLKDADLAQDAVIDIYENLSDKIIRYEIDVFKNWIYSVAKNHCFAQLRENKKEIIVNFDSNLMESDETIDLLGDENNEEEKAAAVNTCVEQLPEPQKISIMAFFFDNKSYAEIVDSTGYHLKSVKSYIQNGRRNLKICLENKLGL